MAEITATTATSKTLPDLAGETDDDLLTYMAWKDEDADTACAALGEFYKRHLPYLHAVCFNAYGDVLKSGGVKDLVTSTFKRAYEKAGTFKVSGLKEEERMRRRVRAWLGRIARRLAADIFRAKAARPEQLLSTDHWAEIPTQSAVHDNVETIALVQRGLDGILDEREREVLRVTFHYYDPESDHQRLPDDVAADLADRLSTTSENLRKIRARALQKMKVFLIDEMAKVSSKE